MAIRNESISLDIKRTGIPSSNRIVVAEHDRGATINFTITDGGSPAALNGVSVVLRADAPGGYVEDPVTLSGSTAVYNLSPELTSEPGVCYPYLAILQGNTVICSTESFELKIDKAADLTAEQAQAIQRTFDELKGQWEEQMAIQEDEFNEAEAVRDEQEQNRVSAESQREEAENERVENESGRVEAENERVNAELERVAAENQRISAEIVRVSQENSRVEAENERVDSEASRIAAELERVSAEEARVEAEVVRETDQAKNNADQSLNNQAVAKLSPYICADGEYDPDTFMPTIEGEANRLYFVPNAQGPGNVYVEWMFINDAWEMMGVSQVEITNITTDDIDSVVSGDSPSGESLLNLTGLSYLWAKIKATFSLVGHTHNYAGSSSSGGSATTAVKLATSRTVQTNLGSNAAASFDGTENITPGITGTLPLVNGGTGATTASAARAALGVSVYSEASAFLAAHPVGSVISDTTGQNPGSTYGGTWVQVPSIGAFRWRRTD